MVQQILKSKLVTPEILENAKDWYLQGNSIRKTTELIFQKYGMKVGREFLRKNLKEIIRTNKRILDRGLIIKLYTQNLISISKLADTFKVAKKTIKKILLEKGIKIRNVKEANRLANTRYIKKPFNGTSQEKSYMIGISLGDLHVRMATKYIVRVNTNSTKESLIKLLIDIFEDYGRVRVYDYGGVFTFIADLDESFNFLLEARHHKGMIRNLNKDNFFSFLSGFIDAEGSLIAVKSNRWWRYFIRIYNSDFEILKIIAEKLNEFEIRSNLKLRWRAGAESIKRNGEKVTSKSEGYTVEVTNKESILKLLQNLGIRHEEKVVKKNLILTNLSQLPKELI